MLLFVYQEDVSKSSLKTTFLIVSKLPETSPFEINDIHSVKLLYIYIFFFLLLQQTNTVWLTRCMVGCSFIQIFTDAFTLYDNEAICHVPFVIFCT